MSQDEIRSWEKERVLVTGGTGFLGGFLCEKLRARGATMVWGASSRDADLTDRAATRRLLRDFQPTIVFHLAARVGGIGANQKNPGRFLFENALMALHVFEEARLCGVRKLIAAGTICAYPKFAPIPFREEDLWNGYPEETNAPYGIAKKLMLVQSSAYRDQYGFNSIVLFPVNLYGPRDNFDLESSHVIPALVRKCITARDAGEDEIVLWGDGTPTREFLYVEDAAEGMLLGAERYNSSEPVNLGSGQEIAIRDLAQVVADATGYRGRFRWDPSRPNGQPRRRLDVRRARDRFGFIAQTSFAEGIRRTVAYYENERVQPRRESGKASDQRP